MTSSKDGVIVRHSELLFLVEPPGGGAFSVIAREINPGLAATFPWLSRTAANFETYCFDSLRYEFKTRTGTFTTGSLIYYQDYDAKDLAPPDYITAATMAGAVSGAPYANLSLATSKAASTRGLTRKYIRSGAPTGDVSLYDAGTLFTCSSNPGGESVWGEMWAHYSVRLYTPQTGPQGPSIPMGALTIYQQSAPLALPPSTAESALVGGLAPAVDQAGLGSTTGGGAIVMKAGKWLVSQINDLATGGTNDGHNLVSTIALGLGTLAESVSQSADDTTGSPFYSQTSNDYVAEFLDGDLLSSIATAVGIGAGTFTPSLEDRSLQLKFLGALTGGFAEVRERQQARITLMAERKARFPNLKRINYDRSEKEQNPPTSSPSKVGGASAENPATGACAKSCETIGSHVHSLGDQARPG